MPVIRSTDLQLRRRANVATRDPSTPPNINVGYDRTWSTYWKRTGFVAASWSVEVSEST